MKRIIIFTALSFLAIISSGQLIPITDQYLLNPLAINPSYAGNRSVLSVSLLYKNQWTGMTGAPETGTFSIDAPLRGERIGLGLMVVADKIGVTNEQQIMTSYSFKVDIGDGILSMGLGAGVIITNTAWSELTVNDPGDEYYLADSRTFYMPEFRFGLYYTYKKYFAGFSVPKFLTYSFDYKKDKFAIMNDFSHYNYLFNTGYTFNLGKRFNFTPSVLLSYMTSEGFSYDVNMIAGYLDRAWFGASYSSNKTLTGIFQFQLTNQVGIGYTYKYDLGSLGRYNNGSHGIMLRYEFRYKVDVTNPLLF